MNTPKSLVSCLCAISLSLAACGPEPEPTSTPLPASGSQAIINGKKCSASEQPSAVGIIIDAKITVPFLGAFPIRSVNCTGTLIAPDTVLTAAHCVHPELLSGGLGAVTDESYYVSFKADLSDMQIKMGGPLPQLPADAVKAVYWGAHPGFTLDLLKNFQGGLSNMSDVALIFLERPVTAVQPAVVITQDEAKQIAKTKSVTISGWGQQSAAPQNPLVPPPPGSVGVKVCATSFINEVGTHELQIGAGSETSRKCHGDSGGPTYLAVTTSHTVKERVVGITSHAYDKTDCAKGGIDTRVDAFLDWIDGMMTSACKVQLRAWCDVEGIIQPSYYDLPPDAGVDQGEDQGVDQGAADGQAAADAAPPDDPAQEGCSCQVARPAAGAPLALLLLLFLLRRWGRSKHINF